MKKALLAVVFTCLGLNVAEAQWRETKGHLVLGLNAGAGASLSDIDKPQWYQANARAMYYWKRPLAFGGDLGLTSASGRFTNYDAISSNLFLHLKLPLGFFAEGGLGATGVISEGRSARYANAGRYWALGYTKKFGPWLAAEAQYRRAPSLQEGDQKNLNSGFRLGILVKI